MGRNLVEPTVYTEYWMFKYVMQLRQEIFLFVMRRAIPTLTNDKDVTFCNHQLTKNFKQYLIPYFQIWIISMIKETG